MRLRIEFTLDDDDEYADPTHEMGVTEAGYIKIGELLLQVGADDISIEPIK